MTTLEIINETVEYYSKDTSRRAATKQGACFYFQISTGNMCAVGRCAILPEELDNSLFTTANIFLFRKLEISDEELFKPEYRGHSVEFWIDLQRLHDNNLNWNESGLSPRGKEQVVILKAKYSQNQ